MTRLLLILLIMFLMVSCSPDSEMTSGGTRNELDRNLYEDRQAYASALSRRGQSDDSVCSFEILGVACKDRMLNVRVRSRCAPGYFVFLWDGVIAESYPAQIRMVLSNESPDMQLSGHAGVCSAELLEHELHIDLSKIRPAISCSDYVFHIANGSKTQDAVLGPDEPVSITGD
ncbi:MAG TPA: hypothetical protein VGD40_02565 [Chryseosolibacter sp.]